MANDFKIAAFLASALGVAYITNKLPHASTEKPLQGSYMPPATDFSAKRTQENVIVSYPMPGTEGRIVPFPETIQDSHSDTVPKGKEITGRNTPEAQLICERIQNTFPGSYLAKSCNYAAAIACASEYSGRSDAFYVGLIKAESNFRHRDPDGSLNCSSAGACGIAQVMECVVEEFQEKRQMHKNNPSFAPAKRASQAIDDLFGYTPQMHDIKDTKKNIRLAGAYMRTWGEPWVEGTQKIDSRERNLWFVYDADLRSHIPIHKADERILLTYNRGPKGFKDFVQKYGDNWRSIIEDHPDLKNTRAYLGNFRKGKEGFILEARERLTPDEYRILFKCN